MEALKIRGNDDVPTIVLDAQKEVFEISGRSLPEDVILFYRPVLEWLDKYAKNPNPKTEFIFKLSYYNTATSKLLMDILGKLELMHEKGTLVKILWYCDEFDEDIYEAGMEFSDSLDVPFEIITF